MSHPLYRHQKAFNPTILVASLGYFVDSFDLFLFNMLRVPSLTELGFSGDVLTNTGLRILNFQVIGMCLGGLLWGVIADKVGRKRALLGSIILYALGSLGCAFVQGATAYTFLRFLTGIGLAGEISVGVTMVSETVPPHKRNWSVAVFAFIGIIGIFMAGIAAEFLPWRWCYAVGGGAGFLVLTLRMLLMEPGLFHAAKELSVKRGNLKLLFTNRDLLKRYFCIVFYTMPYFLVVNVLITLSPEFGKAVGMVEPVKANVALMIYMAGALAADLLAATISQIWKSRLKTLRLFMIVNALLVIVYMTQKSPSLFMFYTLCGVIGLCNFWLLIIAVAAEHFGTNMRATATSAVNVGRATLVITNAILLSLRGHGFDFLHAAQITACIVFTVGFICLLGLQETFERDMNYVEAHNE